MSPKIIITFRVKGAYLNKVNNHERQCITADASSVGLIQTSLLQEVFQNQNQWLHDWNFLQELAHNAVERDEKNIVQRPRSEKRDAYEWRCFLHTVGRTIDVETNVHRRSSDGVNKFDNRNTCI
jgi:hypothetical protein